MCVCITPAPFRYQVGKSDEDIIDATMGELARLFPTEIANDPRWPATSAQVRTLLLFHPNTNHTVLVNNVI